MNIEKKNVKDLLPADYNPRKDLQPGDPEYKVQFFFQEVHRHPCQGSDRWQMG
jgi:hypothetical protein